MKLFCEDCGQEKDHHRDDPSNLSNRWQMEMNIKRDQLLQKKAVVQ